MSTISISGKPKKSVVTGQLHTVILTLVDKDTEIIDDYRNYNSVYRFMTESGDTVVHKAYNQKLDIDLNKKTAFTFLNGQLVAYKANKIENNSTKILDVLSHVRSNPNILISFFAMIVLNLPVFNTLIYFSYALNHFFSRDDYSLINDQIVNTAREKSIVPQALISTLISLGGNVLIFYNYPIVGILVNIVISIPFIDKTNKIEREVIKGKHSLISKIKADLEHFKI
jgi:hypothetical protein